MINCINFISCSFSKL